MRFTSKSRKIRGFSEDLWQWNCGSRLSCQVAVALAGGRASFFSVFFGKDAFFLQVDPYNIVEDEIRPSFSPYKSI